MNDLEPLTHALPLAGFFAATIATHYATELARRIMRRRRNTRPLAALGRAVERSRRH